eukprot:Cvel_12671.t1-p1 / transcript=Cvel_12671.t1 / gene=Cvel_12671 / organism=Chromera_velia_CCMP2878 / gene_product=Exosome complex component CSL4, putative / transcript_product=Exosome complex component CSL4, putative / location=Cvel_scaffold837:62773-64820(+) / protein_length=195 / sequence_SO=supercontig / SO=protein_coding / is_pseudo=false
MGTREIVTPGERLGSLDSVLSGPGTYVENGHVYASVVGFFDEIRGGNEGGEGEGEEAPPLPLVCVRGPRKEGEDMVPKVGDFVLCQVDRVQQQHQRVDVSILSVGSRALRESFRATIRLQDVREFDVQTLSLPDCFRAGDLVRARILTTGDSKSFFVTTSSVDLGVVFAKSVNGFPLNPVSWDCMECSGTGRREF